MVYAEILQEAMHLIYPYSEMWKHKWKLEAEAKETVHFLWKRQRKRFD